MAKQVKLAAERRETTGRSAMRKLKGRGIIPAIVYGGKDKPQPLQVSRRDIKLSEGVTAKMPVDLTAFSVLAPAVEEEPVAAVAEAAAGPEVIKEKKEEGEGAAPATPGTAKAAPPAAKEKEAKK